MSLSLHPRFTVVGPLDGRARAGWIARALGVLLGTPPGDGAGLTFADHAGGRFRLQRDGHGTARLTAAGSNQDLTPAAADLPLDGRFDWFASVGLDNRSALALIRVVPTDFRGVGVDPWEAEDELMEARQVLARIAAEYETGVGQARLAAELYRRAGELDEWLGRLEDERGRRRHAEAVRTVRRLEATVADLGETVEAERREAEAILAAADAAEEWRRAAAALEVAQLALGNRPAAEAPAPPAAEPVSGPDDQPADGRLAQELERAHRAVEDAEREVDRVRLPGAGVMARRRMARAYQQEQEVLARMGCPSWLSYQMRRIDVLQAPGDDDPGAGPPPAPDPPVAVADPEAARAERAAALRRQRTLTEAESACRAARERLEDLLSTAGLLPDAGLDGGPAALTAVLARRATEAAVHRRTPPSAAGLRRAEAKLAEAHTALGTHGRPEPVEMADVAEAPLPDPEPLLAERARLFEEASRIEAGLPEMGRLQDERDVLARHVATLEAAAHRGYRVLSVEEAEMVLLGRVAEARGAGAGEPLPLLVDDAFAAFPAQDRSNLLGLLSQLAETTQVVYLTADAFTLKWAASHSGDELGVVNLAPPGPPTIASVA